MSVLSGAIESSSLFEVENITVFDDDSFSTLTSESQKKTYQSYILSKEIQNTLFQICMNEIIRKKMEADLLHVAARRLEEQDERLRQKKLCEETKRRIRSGVENNCLRAWENSSAVENSCKILNEGSLVNEGRREELMEMHLMSVEDHLSRTEECRLSAETRCKTVDEIYSQIDELRLSIESDLNEREKILYVGIEDRHSFERVYRNILEKLEALR